MRILRTLLIGVLTLMMLLAIALGVAWVRTAPQPLPAGSESAARLAPGAHPVGRVDLEWVDTTRPTPANGDFPGAPERRLAVTLWYPEGASGPHPLAVYCHGFVSSRAGGAYLAEHLASHGYVVLAADFPLTHARAPGGPSFGDVVHQPGDVSFLIDRVLSLSETDRPFAGKIDAERIGVLGLSLGGITTTLVAFHPEWRDPRVHAAISLAGVGDVFGARFYEHAHVPFLMIAGTADALVDYRTNALPILERVRDAGLLTIAGGTHVGFDDIAGGPMRLFGNPDVVACRLGGADPEVEMENPFSGLFGTAEQGLLEVDAYPTPCAKTFDETMKAGRQQRVTTVAVHAFFESRFAHDPVARTENAAFLARTLPGELPEVTYASSPPVPSRPAYTRSP